MPMDMNDKSRSGMRAKRRKTNIILNTLIVVVIILILIVGGTIFFGGDNPNKEETGDAGQPQQEQPALSGNNDEKSSDAQEKTDEEKEDDDKDKDGEVVEKDSDEPNVEKVIVDSSWEPVGTEQESGHQSSYNMGTVDWNEKLEAAAYAIDTSVDHMTPWWVTGGDDPDNQAVLTVSEKGSDDTYRVIIEWVDGEGWKPVEKKKLIRNDRGQ